ncbi:hypothetical protein F4861DRAFT_191641 [Xylaria intraflava]|nr:hypothetical protein F4861DRAFT_191641 [Xylaria intraflava]
MPPMHKRHGGLEIEPAEATASTKCLDCKENNKPCITPTGSLRTRGLELARILDTSSVSTNAVKTAQNAVKTILKNDKNRRQATREANANGGANARNAAAAASAVSSSNTKADADAEYDEYDERRTAALERIADSLERLVAYAAAVPAISETLNIVHRNALEQAEKEADEGSH